MSSTRKAITVAVAAPIAVMLVVLAFMWPMATQSAKDLPVAIVGPEPAVVKVEQALSAKSPELLDLQTAASREEAVQLIEQREVYGAIVLGKSPEVLTAPAAGQAQAAVLGNVAKALESQAGPGATVTVTNIVPTSADDPSGIGINMSVLPIAFGGIIGAVLLSVAVGSARQRLLGWALYVPLAAVAVTFILQNVFNLLPGSFWATSGVFALALGAISAFVVGMKSAFGNKGMGLGIATIMLLANPLAGTMAPKEFIPGGWGAFGQFLPNGAGATLLRSVTYFPAASISTQVWTLLAWMAVGVALIGIGMARENRALATA